MASLRSELRFVRPGLLMRLARWMIARREPAFPRTYEGVRDYLATRALPADAPMPADFATRYRAETREVEGRPVVTLHPPGGADESGWHMLYFHGGGFVMPMFAEHWPLVAAMIDRLGIRVSVPLYAVAHEAGYEPMERQADAAFAMLAESHDRARIVLCGDSAGGHMAISLALRLAARGGAQPGRLALFAPWLDIALEDERARAIEPDDIMLRIDSLRAMGEAWAGSRDRASAEASPLRAGDVRVVVGGANRAAIELDVLLGRGLQERHRRQPARPDRRDEHGDDARRDRSVHSRQRQARSGRRSQGRRDRCASRADGGDAEEARRARRLIRLPRLSTPFTNGNLPWPRFAMP